MPAVFALVWNALNAAEPSAPSGLCRIEVVEKGSGWPVPLVELRTTHQVRFVTGNTGLIAFDLPELMGRETWFDVVGQGYDVPKDGFGFRGVRLKPEPGKTLKVEFGLRLYEDAKPSVFGELWYAEAGAPTGSWGPAVKILSHENYTFYNPRLHPEFTPEGSPMLCFEGTYTVQFSDNKQPPPRYDYNQILYRLDLDDPALQAAQGP